LNHLFAVTKYHNTM